MRAATHLRSRIIFFTREYLCFKEVQDDICLVTFVDYDLGYIDLEEKTLQPLNNPFGPKV